MYLIVCVVLIFIIVNCNLNIFFLVKYSLSQHWRHEQDESR